MLGYSGAPSRGARVAQFPGEFRQAEDGEFDGVNEDIASSIHRRADRVMCSEVVSMSGEQNEQNEQNMTSFYPLGLRQGAYVKVSRIATQ